jgi:transposase
MRKPYSTDLSDAEWGYIEPYLPTPKAPGRPRVHSLREILNTIESRNYVEAAAATRSRKTASWRNSSSTGHKKIRWAPAAW